jgi:thioredoxin reductase
MFHLGTTATSIDERRVTLERYKLQADFVVVGIGVRPETALAARAGLAVDRGVTVDEYLETSAPRVLAAKTSPVGQIGSQVSVSGSSTLLSPSARGRQLRAISWAGAND